MENTTVQAEITEIRAVRRQTRIWLWSMYVVLVVVPLVSVMVMWNDVAVLIKNGPRRDIFVEKLGTALQTEGTLIKLQEVGEEAIHSVNFNKEVGLLNQRTPKVASAGLEQMRQLAVEIPAGGKKILNQQYVSALQGCSDKLKQEFPDITPEQMTGLLDGLTNLSQAQLSAVTDALFSPHIDAMNEIVTDLDTIKTKEGAKAQEEMPTWEMAFLISDIMRSDLDGSSELPATQPAPVAGNTKKGKKQ